MVRPLGAWARPLGAWARPLGAWVREFDALRGIYDIHGKVLHIVRHASSLQLHCSLLHYSLPKLFVAGLKHFWLAFSQVKLQKPLLYALFLVIFSQQAAWSESQTAIPDFYEKPLQYDRSVAWFGFTFIDTSAEGAYNGVRQDEVDRVALIETLVVDWFEKEKLQLVDISSLQAELDNVKNIAKCNGCEVDFAKRLGAGYVLTGEVQKVSNLILAMNLVMRHVPSGAMVRGLSVDIRSNTDRSWTRGISYILKNHFFREIQ